MVHFRWINMSLLVILLLQFTAVTGQTPLAFIARVGDEVTLPCENVINNQDRCDSTTWVASGFSGETLRELVTLGKINTREISKARLDRLSVTAKCSLVIKKVTDKDAGRYTCRQYKSGVKQGGDALVHLSVIYMNELQTNDTVSLICSVLTYGRCEFTVTWLYEGNKDGTEMSQLSCAATFTFTTPPQNSNYYELLKCNVTEKKSGQTLLCNADPQSSCERTGSTLEGSDTTSSANDDTTTESDSLWRFIVVSVGLAALLIIIVAVIIWKKTKGNKTRMDENMRQSLNPAETRPGPETRQDVADPEGGVSYASVRYTKKANSKARVCGNEGDDDEGDAVTYSIVKSTDPSNLYATINKPNKKEAAV